MKLMKSPRIVDIAITNNCNLRCLYCSYFSSPSDVDRDLPKEEWLRFFEELNKNNVMQVILQGGEPLFRKDIKDIINGIVENRMRYKILTNGTLITDNIAAFIASNKRCELVQVSIDGSSATTHDIFRGKGNFERAIDGMMLLKKYNIPTTVRVTIHKGNVKDLDNIAKFLLDDMKLLSFSTNSAAYLGLCRKNSEMVRLTPKEHTIAMNSLLRLNKKYKGRITAKAGPLSNGLAWAEMEKSRLSGKASKTNRGYLTACGSINSRIAVRADGIIVPCSQLAHIELGRINKDNFSEVWNNHPELNKLRERKFIPLAKFEFCKGCDYIPYCTGNCPAIAYTLIGRTDHPNPEGCLRQFLKNGGKLPEDIPLSDVHMEGCY